MDATQITFHVGAKWSEDLRDYAGTELCELPHFALVHAGTIGVEMRERAYLEFSAGDVMLLPPGRRAFSAFSAFSIRACACRSSSEIESGSRRGR